MKNEKTILKEIEKAKATARSKWARGVLDYAAEIADDLELNGSETFANYADFKKRTLNGADNWSEYSWGGCSLIYDADICDRLATPSEQARTHHGEKAPNAREQWLDTQARALGQACGKLYEIITS